MAKYLTKERANAAITSKAIPRLMKAYNYHNKKYQVHIADLLDQIVLKGKDYIDIPTIISMVLCPYPQIQNIGVRTLAKISDNAGDGNKTLDSEFENHIPFLFEAYETTKNTNPQYRQLLLTTLANLAIRDYLRPIIIDHKGL